MISVDIVTQSFNLSIVGQTARNRSTVDNLQGGKRNIFLYIFLKRTNRLTANKLSDYYFCVIKTGKKKKKEEGFPGGEGDPLAVAFHASREGSKRRLSTKRGVPLGFLPSVHRFLLFKHSPGVRKKKREKKKQIKKKKYTPSKCLGNGNRNFLSTPQRVGKLGDRYALVDSIRIDCDA